MAYARAVGAGRNWFARQRPIVKGGIIVGGGILVYKIIQAFSNDKSGGTSDELDVEENNLTYPLNNYKVFADGIEAAIWGTSAFPSFTEDDDAIGAILKAMQTTDDVYELVTAYGIRTRGALLEDGGNLVESIQQYLDDDVRDEVNALYQQKNIDFLWP